MIALPVVVFSRPWTPHARVLKMPRLSNEYGILEVTCKLKWFWDLFFITSVRSITRQLALWVLALGKIQSRLVETGDFVNWIKIFFSKNFCSKPIITLHTWQIGLTEQSCLMVNSLYKNVLWYCYFYNLLWKGSVCFYRPEHWMSAICLVRLFRWKTAEL